MPEGKSHGGNPKMAIPAKDAKPIKNTKFKEDEENWGV